MESVGWNEETGEEETGEAMGGCEGYTTPITRFPFPGVVLGDTNTHDRDTLLCKVRLDGISIHIHTLAQQLYNNKTTRYIRWDFTWCSSYHQGLS